MSGSGGSSRRCGARGGARPGKGCPFRDPCQWSTSVCGQAIPGELEHYATLQMMHLGEGSARATEIHLRVNPETECLCN